MVRLTGDTMLAIDKLTVSDTGLDTVSDTELDLKQGRIFCSVKKLSAASQYLVKIPNGIAGVRGCCLELTRAGGVRSSKIRWSLLPTRVPCCFPSSGQTALRRRIRWVKAINSLLRPVKFLPCRPTCSVCCSKSAMALDTVYLEVVSFEYDQTFCFISPIQRPSLTVATAVGSGHADDGVAVS